VDIASLAVDPEHVRRPPSGGSPLLDVVTPEDAIVRLQQLAASRPATDVFLWASVAGMPDDVAERHQDLVARRLAPALAIRT
jgi:hypothetical protein